MSPLTLQWFPQPVSHTALTPQHPPARLPVCSATAPVSPPFTHIPPTPTGHCTKTPTLPQCMSSPPPQCSWLPPDSHPSSFNPPAQQPNPSTSSAWFVPGVPTAQWSITCQAPSQAPSSRRGIKQNTALSVITERGKHLIVTQCYRRNKEKKPNHKSKTHHFHPSLKLAEFVAYKSFTLPSTESFALKRPWRRVNFSEAK